MRVVHVSPTFFDASSIIGGGERYPTDLATHMAEREATTLVAFDDRPAQRQVRRLTVRVFRARPVHGSRLNPLTLRHLPLLLRADVVHFHQVQTLASDLGALFCRLTRRPAYVTDYGGGGSLVLNRRLPVFKGYRAAVAYSSFGRTQLPPDLKDKAVLIKGGVDVDRFRPDEQAVREDKVLFVGRLLPHKGVDYLIDAFRRLARPGARLVILGRPYSDEYHTELQRLSSGLPVEFVVDADDSRLLHEYRTSRVTVLPSVHTDSRGRYTPVPELLGLTLLESQACGTPVVCTDAGAMPEFVDHSRTGFVVPQNSGEALASAIGSLMQISPGALGAFAARSREWVRPFSWQVVVDEHLALYRQAHGSGSPAPERRHRG